MITPAEQSAGPEPFPTRRAALALGATAGAAVLAGCSVYGEPASTPQATAGEQTQAGTDDGASAGTDDGASAGTGGGGGGAAALAKTSDIPVGGGKIFAAQGLVVTQPTAGTFKAFSTVCTHQGCAVDEVKGGTINCPCHGSKFKIADGSVAGDPAPKPLPAKKITVDGDSLKLA